MSFAEVHRSFACHEHLMQVLSFPGNHLVATSTYSPLNIPAGWMGWRKRISQCCLCRRRDYGLFFFSNPDAKRRRKLTFLIPSPILPHTGNFKLSTKSSALLRGRRNKVSSFKFFISAITMSCCIAPDKCLPFTNEWTLACLSDKSPWLPSVILTRCLLSIPYSNWTMCLRELFKTISVKQFGWESIKHFEGGFPMITCCPFSALSHVFWNSK